MLLSDFVGPSCPVVKQQSFIALKYFLLSVFHHEWFRSGTKALSHSSSFYIFIQRICQAGSSALQPSKQHRVCSLPSQLRGPAAGICLCTVKSSRPLRIGRKQA